jgi:hypothetical protein
MTNARRKTDGLLMYQYSMTAGGRFRVAAVYTGLPTGCIGSGGKSFATAAERDAATAASVDRLVAKLPHWEKVEE